MEFVAGSRNMLLIGLTGSIATGKSTVSKLLESASIPIVDADLIARQIVEPGTPSYHSVITVFPDCVHPTTHEIDRHRLGALIFSNPQLRTKLNGLTHPWIKIEMFVQVLRHFLQGETVCVLDAPLLLEVGLDKLVHKTIVVYWYVSLEN